MGRRGNAERLANPAFKMAAISMADLPEFQRPVHEAFIWKKIVCPEASCLKEKLFFEEKGLGHHFRTIHKKEANAKVVSKALIKTRELYGQETLEYIAAFSEWKSKVSICIIYVLNVLRFKWNSCYANDGDWFPTWSRAICSSPKFPFCLHFVGLRR